MVTEKVKSLEQIVNTMKRNEHHGETEIEFKDKDRLCGKCGAGLTTHKTISRKVKSIAFGSVNVREWELVCPKNCDIKDNGKLKTFRNSQLY